MSRTRMYGTIAAVVACAGFVAGCGGSGGYTAAESAPTPTAGAPATAAPTAAPATPGAESVIGSFAASDPALAKDQTFSGYQRFPKDRAGKIFVGPDTPETSTGTTPPATPATSAPVTTVPLPGSGSGSGSGTPSGGATPVTAAAPPAAGGATPPTPAPVTTKLSASLSVDNKVQTVVVGNQVPEGNPLFTVQAITSSTVTLKANSGALPGGGTTIDLAVGQPVTLSNPSTGTTLVINVVEIKAQV